MLILSKAKNDYGYCTIEEMLEEATFDSICPGICSECLATRDVEPDACNYDCCECNSKGTGNSVLVIAGLI